MKFIKDIVLLSEANKRCDEGGCCGADIHEAETLLNEIVLEHGVSRDDALRLSYSNSPDEIEIILNSIGRCGCCGKTSPSASNRGDGVYECEECLTTDPEF